MDLKLSWAADSIWVALISGVAIALGRFRLAKDDDLGWRLYSGLNDYGGAVFCVLWA